MRRIWGLKKAGCFLALSPSLTQLPHHQSLVPLHLHSCIAQGGPFLCRPPSACADTVPALSFKSTPIPFATSIVHRRPSIMEVQHLSSPGLLAGDDSEQPNFDTAADGRIEMAQEDIDAIIRNKRKVRDPKACYACHRRKVKCDRNLPCDSCIKRDHPELCSYERPTKKRRIALPGPMGQHEGTPFDGHDPALQTGPNVTVPREQWERMNRELQRLRTQVKSESLSPGGPHTETDDPNAAGTHSRSDEAEREGIHAPSNQMGTMHLGSRSVLAYMMALGRSQTTQDTARSLLEENILPKLGLDNESATYPFVDLWSTASSMQDVSGLCKAIPDDELCRE